MELYKTASTGHNTQLMYIQYNNTAVEAGSMLNASVEAFYGWGGGQIFNEGRFAKAP